MSPSHPRLRERKHLRLLARTLALGAALCGAADASAAGLYFGDRGVRPLGRAGAFVAGGDDLGAMAYNPAGIYEAGAQVLVDGSWVNFTSEYTRQNVLRQTDPNTGASLGESVQTYPTVHGTTPFIPIPTLAVSFKPHPQWVVALGVWAPNATLASYPDKVDNKAAPQRYSLITLDGSLLAFVGASAAFAPSPKWRIGGSLGVLTGKFNSVVDFSGCVPERFLCAPEDPNWDVLGELSVAPIVAPFGQLGAIWIPTPAWRVGLSATSPIFVRSHGTLRTRMPAVALFERAEQKGQDVDVAFNLPFILRAGVETRLVDHLRVEAGLAFETWGVHDTIAVHPEHISLENIAGFPKSYYLPDINLPRRFQNSFSVRAGGEYTLKAGSRVELQVRGGLSYETSAITENYLSVLTWDANKITTALGGSVKIGRIRLDATYAHVFPFDVTIDPKNAQIPQVSPVAANPPVHPNYINGGLYTARANIIGLGLAYTFDPAPVEFTTGAPAAATSSTPAITK